MAIEGDGLRAVKAIWVLLALAFVFAALRAVNRIFVVRSYGLDDNVYNLAFLFMLFYGIFITLSVRSGLGQAAADVNAKDRAQAILWELVGQTFAVLGTAIAKVSFGLFLLRLINRAALKAILWATMGILMIASVSTCLVLWLQCTPPAYYWEKSIPGGYCYVEATTAYTFFSAICVVVDFSFPIVPWLFLRHLQLPRLERLIVQASMSLGLIAGACGIQRSLQVSGLASDNHLKDTVGLAVWTAAEMAMTLVCIGIPACRSLCKRFRARLASADYSVDYKRKARRVYGLRSDSDNRRLRLWNGAVQKNKTMEPRIPIPPPIIGHYCRDPLSAIVVGSACTPITTTTTAAAAVSSPIAAPSQAALSRGCDRGDEEALIGLPVLDLSAGSLTAGIRVTQEFRVTGS